MIAPHRGVPSRSYRWLALLCALVLPRASSGAEAGTTLLLSSAADAQPERAGLVVSRFFEDKTRGLPPNRPAFALEFPLHLAERFLWDTGYILTSPGRWQTREWTGFALVAAGTGGLFAADRTIDIESRRRHPRSSGEQHFEDGVEEFGDLPGVAALIVGPELFGFFTDNDEAKELGVDAGEAAAISALLTGSIKEITGRARPNRGDGPFRFRPFSGNASFPSGHVTAAFALAATVSEHFENRLWIAAPAYGLAGLVALARTRANAHFASDVFFGAAIGTSTARTLVDLQRDRIAQEQQGGYHASISPLLIGGLPGISMDVRF